MFWELKTGQASKKSEPSTISLQKNIILMANKTLRIPIALLKSRKPMKPLVTSPKENTMMTLSILGTVQMASIMNRGSPNTISMPNNMKIKSARTKNLLLSLRCSTERSLWSFYGVLAST